MKLNKKEFHRSKQPIYLNQVEISKIVVSDEFKLDDCVKNCIEYKNSETVKPLCIILPQTSGFIKYFLKTTKKKMPFLADDDNDGILKYNKIWKKLTSYLVLNLIVSLFMMKNTLNQGKNFWRQSYYKIYKQWNSKRKYSLFMYCCNFCWFCNKTRKRNISKVNLEQCQFRLKKKKNIDFFDHELEDSSDESEIVAEENNVLCILRS